MASTTQSQPLRSRRAGGTAKAGGGTRLPSNRERRPLLAVLAVLLIVGGAAAAGVVALRLADRTDYAYIGVDLGTGQQIQRGDILIVSLTADEVANPAGGGAKPNLVTAEEAQKYVREGWYSKGEYPAGTLVNDQMFVKSNTFPADTARVGLVLAPEQTVSTELGISDRIEIYSTSSDAGAPATKVGEGTIVDIADKQQRDSSVGTAQGTHVTVQIQEADLPAVAQAAGNGTVYVAVIAPENAAESAAESASENAAEDGGGNGGGNGGGSEG